MTSAKTDEYLSRFRHLRGAYVDCTYDVRDLQNGELPPGKSTLAKANIEWRERKAEGILGFSKSGYPQFDGETWFLDSFRKYAHVNMVERFRPAKNAIRWLCMDCGDVRPNRRRSILDVRVHPIAVALKAARRRMDQTWGKSRVCSVCGANGDRGIYRVPSDLLWITTETPDDVIEKALAGDAFARVMKDATMQLWLWECSAQNWNGTTQYSLRWRGSHGEYVSGKAKEPPPSAWWDRWMPLEDISPWVSYMATNDGHILRKEHPC